MTAPTPAPRHDRRTALLALALVVLVAAALLATRCARRRREPPGTLHELAARLQAQAPGLRVIPSREDGRWSDTAYVTADPSATWRTLQGLPLHPESLPRWRGFVWVRQIDADTDVEGLLLSWQGHGRLAGGFLVFGDPDLTERVSKAARGD